MQLLNAKCPNCGGTLKLAGNLTAECEYCDSVFLINGEEAPNSMYANDFEDGFDFESDDYASAEPLDILAELTKMNDSGSIKDSDDWFMGRRRVDDDLVIKRRSWLFKVTGAPLRENVWGMVDTTLFHTGRQGALVCENGWYFLDQNGKKGFLSWSEFAHVDIDISGVGLLIGSYNLIAAEKREAYEKLCKLQDKMLRSGN